MAERLTTEEKVAIAQWAVPLSKALQEACAVMPLVSLHNHIPGERLGALDGDLPLGLAMLRASFSLVRLVNDLNASLEGRSEVLRLLADEPETVALYQRQAAAASPQPVDVNASDAGVM